MSSSSRAAFRVLNVSWTCVRNDLGTYFKKYGRVHRINIPMDRQTGFNLKTAYVEMEGEDGFVEKILQDFHKIDDQEVTVKLDTPMSRERGKQEQV